MAIVKPSTILEPFATNGDLVAPPATPSTTVANQDTGFPPLQSTKFSLGGLPVKRDQMNGIINLYSQFAFWQQCGGQYTFDQDVSDEYGGYPAGIVLWCASNNSYQVSLVNSNTANFVTIPSYINDGTNWSQIGGSHGQAIFTSVGAHSFPIPAGVTEFYVTAIGAGGGGAAGYFNSNQQGAGGGGGGSGAILIKHLITITSSGAFTFTIGSGGIGATTNGATGASGTATTISQATITTITLNGGQGGNPTGLKGRGGGGGSPIVAGATGNTGGGATFFDNAGGLSYVMDIAGGTGAGGIYGSGTGGATSSGDASDAIYGNGGGGGGAEAGSSTSFSAGGNGGNGFVLIEW